MTNYKQLCADLVEIWDSTSDFDYNDFGNAAADLVVRARAALAEPELEPPTDAELLCIAAEAIDGYGNGINPGDYEPATERTVESYGSELCDFARAVLARWGNYPANPDTSPQPIPVSERMPTDEDCNKEGMCWWWHPSHPESGYSEGWMQRPRQWGAVRYDFDDALVYTHWLPAHALPLPTHD